ncbi:MAG TPA: HAD family hydrolase [Aquificaceae bacterium]|nr:HAD family hydrolase [Aquificaceae bacterium]
MKPALVLFDLDGTIVDSMGVYAKKAAELISEHYGVPQEISEEMYLKTSGLPFLKQLEILFPANERNELVARSFEEWKGKIVKRLKVDGEAVYVIKSLRERGVLTAVSSNNLQEYVERIVRGSGVEVDYVLGWDGGTFMKGEPHVKYLERVSGLSRKDFVMVGDSPNDLKLAKSSGVEFIALERSFSRNDFLSIDPSVKVIKSLRELPQTIYGIRGDR